MIKKILLQVFVFLALYFIALNVHELILKNLAIEVPLSLKKIYQFHVGFSLLICFNFTLLSTVDKIFQQLGLLYLLFIFLKIVVFIYVFYNPIFEEENLAFSSRISLFIPLIIFLLTEAIFIAKILNKK